MAKNPEYVPRLNVVIREDQLEDLQRLLPYGLRKAVYEYLTDEIIRLMKVDASTFLGAVLSRKIALEELINLKGDS